MNAPLRFSVVPIAVVVLFLLLSASFLLDVWRAEPTLYEVVVSDSTFGEPSTVRFSASELVRLDGDTSMFACYSCHEEGETPELGYDEDGNLIWEEHKFDFDLEHGENHRNEFCFTCHDQGDLEKLRTPDGTVLELTEGNVLCGSCHGTMYRDWESNLHGRRSGYWDQNLGPSKSEDCTSCHNAHIPAFPSLPPYAGPQPLRPTKEVPEDVHE